MAKLVGVIRSDEYPFERRQLPLQCDDTLSVRNSDINFIYFIFPSFCRFIALSSEERGTFNRNATKTWVEGGDLPLFCRAAPLS